MAHHWHETTVEDKQGNAFQAFQCVNCEYRVVAFPHPDLGDGGTMHLPDHKMILVGKEEITPEEAEQATVVWGVSCKVG